jgi:hypothetical protein
MDEKKRYIFKTDYECSLGKINEGREITQFKGILFIDGIMIPEPYASDIRKLFSDDKFLKEYIRVENTIKNKV